MRPRETVEELVRRLEESLRVDERYHPDVIYVGAVIRHDGLLLYSAFQAVEAPVVEAPASVPETVPAKPAPEEKESLEDIKKRARKPPAEGPCRGCGKNLPLNRLMLCYRCWVNKENSKGGWREGQPHPETCGCDLDCRFDDKGADN